MSSADSRTLRCVHSPHDYRPNEFVANDFIFEGLVEWNGENPNGEDGIAGNEDDFVKPSLATSWTAAMDGTQYHITFQLRKDVKFHDDSPWNAAAAIWPQPQLLRQKVARAEAPHRPVRARPVARAVGLAGSAIAAATSPRSRRALPHGRAHVLNGGNRQKGVARGSSGEVDLFSASTVACGSIWRGGVPIGERSQLPFFLGAPQAKKILVWKAVFLDFRARF